MKPGRCKLSAALVLGAFVAIHSQENENPCVDAFYSLGAEFRVSDPSRGKDDEFQTNYILLRGSLSVPITASNNLSVGFGLPLVGDVSPTMSINGNWGLLLPDIK
jgi:hypothetical protein